MGLGSRGVHGGGRYGSWLGVCTAPQLPNEAVKGVVVKDSELEKAGRKGVIVGLRLAVCTPQVLAAGQLAATCRDKGGERGGRGGGRGSGCCVQGQGWVRRFRRIKHVGQRGRPAISLCWGGVGGLCA